MRASGVTKEFDHYDAADPDGDFDAINPIAAAPQDGQVDPIMNHPFQLNDEDRVDAVQSATVVVPQ